MQTIVLTSFNLYCYNIKKWEVVIVLKDRLTKRQKQIYDCICDAIRANGYPPSVREICSDVGLKSSATVHNHLISLEKKGYIRRDPAKPRAIEILNEDIQLSSSGICKIPILGQVTAGVPILAQENIEDYFPLPENLVKKDTIFMLQVSGDSMIEKGIHDQDYVVVRQQSNAENGDIVVALIGEEATVKTFYREPKYIRLQPENQEYSPIITRDVSIVGKVIAIFRYI